MVGRNPRSKHAVYDQRCQTRFQCDGRMGRNLCFCNERKLKSWHLQPGKTRAATRAMLYSRGTCYRLSLSKRERMKRRSRLRKSKERMDHVRLGSIQRDVSKCAGKKTNSSNMRQKRNHPPQPNPLLQARRRVARLDMKETSRRQ